MNLDELKLPKNNLFKLTCRDRHDTPNYTFSWELTSEGASNLKKENVRFPFMYILVVEEISPAKVEGHASGCGCDTCTGQVKIVEEKLYCLHEGAGLIQFRRQGTFRIYAMVVWRRDEVLEYSSWKTHRNYTWGYIKQYSDPIVRGSKLPSWALQHVEEDAVTITSSFFASKPNPILWWWANLWFENKPRNSCDYKKRLLFLLWLQVPTVSIYVIIRGLLMVPSYLGLLLIGFRPSSFSLRPMFRPFSSIFKQICDFDSKTSNWVSQDSKGQDRQLVRDVLIRLPIIWFSVPILTYYLGKSIYYHPMAWLTVVEVILGVITAIAAIVGGIFLHSKLKTQKQSVEVYYKLVPIEQPKKRRVPVKTRWVDAKGKLCLPFPE